MTTTSAIRDRFLSFFAAQDHRILPSAPLVPRGDPSLFFTNSGMVPFKNIFTGKETSPYPRVATAQKCLRAGGKHNDLENVGYTARHHTFFEMLGNFSFSDYFKEQAIELAWLFLTKEISLPSERLLVTIHASDEEAASLWRQIAGLPSERIISIDSSDNFWTMGESGPCGPCSEIFYDRGPDVPGSLPGHDYESGDRFVEIWNLVFMQFEQESSGRRRPLPSPSIDTGMGLERMAAVLQNKHSNYDTDILHALREAVRHIAGIQLGDDNRASLNIIADHLRAIAFLIAEGVRPTNEGQGYVLRRISRRAMRHAYRIGQNQPFLWRLVPIFIDLMNDHYPELGRAQDFIIQTLHEEEERFGHTLDRGLRLLENAMTLQGGARELSGEIAFNLYDTHGFPLDLTEDILREHGMSLDRKAFEVAMSEQRARATWTGSGETHEEQLSLSETFSATQFLGYESEKLETSILALIQEGQDCQSLSDKSKASAVIIAAQTPFYAESGGQLSDQGIIAVPGSGRFQVTAVKKVRGLILHKGHMIDGHIDKGQRAHFEIDSQRRACLTANHSATHLLHAALRRHLGDQITQRGSHIAPDRLRFDITYPGSIAESTLRAVEAEVNEHIRLNDEVTTRIMDLDDALKQGALTLLGKDYSPHVRVVAMGGLDLDGQSYSLELCGGTHVHRLGAIGAFRIIAESGVAAGIRRLEACTGAAALAYDTAIEQAARMAAIELQTTIKDLPERVGSLLQDYRRLKSDWDKLENRSTGTAYIDERSEIAGISCVFRCLKGIHPRALKGVVDAIKRDTASGVVAVIGIQSGKATLVVGVREDLTNRLSAVILVQAGARPLGGKGGGRPDMAQAGGPYTQAAAQSLEAIANAIRQDMTSS